MKTFIVVAGVLAVFAATELSLAEEPPAKYPLFSQLTIPKDDLPAGCEIAQIPADATPVAGFKNPSVITDPKDFPGDDERMKELIASDEVEALYLSVYKERGRDHGGLGISAYACTTAVAAQETHKKLAASYGKKTAHSKFWQVENYVVWLWGDPGITEGCWQGFATFIQKKVVAFGKNATAGRSGDSPPGSIKLIGGYRYEALQGVDTDVGKIWKEGGLTIKHDIGRLAGLYAKPEEQADYLWYKEQVIDGQPVRCALTKDDRLLVTFPRDYANFYVNFHTPADAVDVRPEDVADVLLMVLTYQGREPS